MNWSGPVTVSAMLAIGLLLTAAGPSQAQAPAGDLKVDQKGLTFQYAGAEVLAPSVMEMSKISLKHGYPPAAVPTPGKPETSFDAGKLTTTQTYPWGTLTCVYRQEADKLFLDLEVRNTTKKDSIFGFSGNLLQLRMPGEVKLHGWAHGWPTPSILNDAVQAIDASWSEGSLAVCNEQVDRPLMLNITRQSNSDLYTVSWRHDGPPAGQEIGPNDQRKFLLSIRFGPKGSSSPTFAKDLYERYAQRYPSELNWKDRRPIGCCFLSSIESRSKTNPTGWLHDSTVDMTTEAGRADWAKRILARADKAVSVAKEMGAQGVITWDIEGQRNPHNISYIGDPRLMPILSPEMDPIADAYFKKFTDAGLRVGVTLRPTHVVRTPGGKEAWEHINTDDIVAEIAGKLEYARKRWGCTIFYVDSTVRWDLTPEGEFSLHTLPAVYFQSLAQRYPDVLLIPEESTTRHHAYTAPYHEVMAPQFYTCTPPEIRAAYPNAFTIIRVAEWGEGGHNIEKYADALIKGVRSGDILMFRTWLDDPENIPIKKILDAAK